MNLKHIAIISVVMGVAAVMMFITAPLAGSVAAVITVFFDTFLGDNWASIPIVHLAPLAIVYLGYCVAIGLVLLFVVKGGGNEPYPPLDEDGEPMILSFSSRGGPSRWVRRHRP